MLRHGHAPIEPRLPDFKQDKLGIDPTVVGGTAAGHFAKSDFRQALDASFWR
jgi:hypothetical protein